MGQLHINLQGRGKVQTLTGSRIHPAGYGGYAVLHLELEPELGLQEDRRRLALDYSLPYPIAQGESDSGFGIGRSNWRIVVMSIDKDLVAILCCPETKQAVTMADATLVKKLNEAVAHGGVMNKGKKPVSEQLDGGLVRADMKILYPIREHIPVMLIEEGIPLDQVR